jgi:hypothetical protein
LGSSQKRRSKERCMADRAHRLNMHGKSRFSRFSAWLRGGSTSTGRFLPDWAGPCPVRPPASAGLLALLQLG